MGLQQFGVIPFEIRSLKIGHTEQRRTQRFYIVEIVRHRGTVGVWSIRGYLRVLLMFLSTSLQSSGFTRFLKNVYYQSYQQHVHYASVALCAFGTSVILSASTSVFSSSLCDLLYIVGLLYHSIFRKTQTYWYIHINRMHFNAPNFCIQRTKYFSKNNFAVTTVIQNHHITY